MLWCKLRRRPPRSVLHRNWISMADILGTGCSSRHCQRIRLTACTGGSGSTLCAPKGFRNGYSGRSRKHWGSLLSDYFCKVGRSPEGWIRVVVESGRSDHCVRINPKNSRRSCIDKNLQTLLFLCDTYFIHQYTQTAHVIFVSTF